MEQSQLETRQESREDVEALVRDERSESERNRDDEFFAARTIYTHDGWRG